VCSEGARTARGRWVALACMFMSCSGAVRASASEHEHPAGSPIPEAADLDPRTAAVASRLWNDLVCLCDRCERLTLAACHCPDAAAERKKVLELLRGKDLSSPTASEAAYRAVVESYVGRLGQQVLASERSRGLSGDVAAWIGAVAVIVAACGAFVAVERRRRRRAAPSRSRSRRR
jgi:hypothetical protein